MNTLYVSSTLDYFESNAGNNLQGMNTKAGTFKQLDPDYYAWLFIRVQRAKRLLVSKQQSDKALQLNIRWESIDQWARNIYGEQVLEDFETNRVYGHSSLSASG